MFKHCQRLVSSFLFCLITCLALAGCNGKSEISSTASSTGPQTEQTGPQTELQDKSAAEKGVKVTILEIQPPAGQSSAEEKTGAEADAGSGAEAAGQGETSAAETQPPASDQAAEEEWQGKVTFPDWKGYTDDTLAMNHMYSFFGYHGQGTLRICPAGKVTESAFMSTMYSSTLQNWQAAGNMTWTSPR